MNLPPLRPEDLAQLADALGVEIASDEVADFLDVAEFIRTGLRSLDADLDPPGSDSSDREAGRSVATVPRDPYNAVVAWCDVGGDRDGVLAGRTIGVKDSIAVAGVPTTCGFEWLAHVPDRNATVVDRTLEAGGRVVAKLNMDALAWSGGADTSSFGRVGNPVNTTWSAGGSSGGSAAALYLPEVDISFGTDQGGSVRIPASWCGVLGMKPTFGLVPYTGIVGMEASIDHVGPLARSVEDLSAALTAIAGPDGDDPRQSPDLVGEDYRAAIEGVSTSLQGVTIGVLSEGFELGDDPPPGTEETARATHMALESLGELGARLVPVSIPKHRSAPAALFVMLMENMAASFDSPTAGYGHRGNQDWELDLARTSAMRSAGTSMPATARIAALMGAHLRTQYSGAAYSWVRTWSRGLASDFDRALTEVDFIAMPTATHYAHPFRDDLPISEQITRGWDMFANTISTNISGNPAVSLPMARAGPHPVGVMFVGRTGADASLLRLARAIEQAVGWFPQPTD